MSTTAKNVMSWGNSFTDTIEVFKPQRFAECRLHVGLCYVK